MRYYCVGGISSIEKDKPLVFTYQSGENWSYTYLDWSKCAVSPFHLRSLHEKCFGTIDWLPKHAGGEGVQGKVIHVCNCFETPLPGEISFKKNSFKKAIRSSRVHLWSLFIAPSPIMFKAITDYPCSTCHQNRRISNRLHCWNSHNLVGFWNF